MGIFFLSVYSTAHHHSTAPHNTTHKSKTIDAYKDHTQCTHTAQLGEEMLVAVSDKMKGKGRQPFRCLAKDQSIHVFVLPEKADKPPKAIAK